MQFEYLFIEIQKKSKKKKKPKIRTNGRLFKRFITILKFKIQFRKYKCVN